MTGRSVRHQEPHPCLVFPTLFIRLSVVSQHWRKVSSRAISDCQYKSPARELGCPSMDGPNCGRGFVSFCHHSRIFRCRKVAGVDTCCMWFPMRSGGLFSWQQREKARRSSLVLRFRSAMFRRCRFLRSPSDHRRRQRPMPCGTRLRDRSSARLCVRRCFRRGVPPCRRC